MRRVRECLGLGEIGIEQVGAHKAHDPRGAGHQQEVHQDFFAEPRLHLLEILPGRILRSIWDQRRAGGSRDCAILRLLRSHCFVVHQHLFSLLRPARAF